MPGPVLENQKLISLANRLGISNPTEKDLLGLRSMIGGTVANAVGDIGESITSNISKNAVEGYDPRESPISTMKRANTANAAGSILKATAGGAASGAIAGPIGMAIGAGVGLLTSGIKQAVGIKGRKQDMLAANEEWSYSNLESVKSGMQKYKKGGKVSSDSKPTPGKSNKNWIPLTDANVSAALNLDTETWNSLSDDDRISLVRNSGKMIALKGKGATANKGGIQYFEKTDIPKELNNTYSDATDMLKTKFKSGGKIVGKGSAKSDSINMKAEDGSFIVPAENSALAKQLGIDYLGWSSDEKASKENGSTKINASNGEVIFTPEEVSILEYHGVDLNELAPHANDGDAMKCGGKVKKNKYSTGGWILNPSSGEYEYDANASGDDPGYQAWKNNSGSDNGTKAVKVGDKTQNAKGEKEKLGFGLPEIASLVQAAAGIAGMTAQGEAPDLEVSNRLKSLSAETRRQAAYGLDPSTINTLERSVARDRSDVIRSLTQKGGDSGQELMQKINVAVGASSNALADIRVKDAELKREKFKDVIGVDTEFARQELDVEKFNLSKYYENQDLYAGLINTGIESLIGARQFRKTQDTLNKIDSRPTINVK